MGPLILTNCPLLDGVSFNIKPKDKKPSEFVFGTEVVAHHTSETKP